MADVTWNEDESRYELRADGAFAGFADVAVADGVATFTHTEISHGFQGKGLAGVLAHGALTDATARGLAVRAQCPYIRAYLKKHTVEGVRVVPNRA
ncbi:GNAT family N-acetyltransferase [Demequina lignilytica]|uniref:GNAT family N-acetyltransferase n=1 Tax=Demequina lignilytica TaxID=3051663 RepID=A0AAW7M3T3_9MICO|nr:MULTISPECIES: GNAT family N-acetyltransferase [unclassified Demequina]MDN4478396.1 GNAT family N-acetyltransferase [Demequina sp. SYSU T00039-1]MDN4482444.1 GNAT family N-acetyltransferase [Demequina sp. SYSU T0a273]MDN4487097.1 GNAT family N-acetyltransferase [Demequina sp. SYSU T00039]MDN4489808.1 GNAT family N-acetyltransferase [Demequina sp. SYSU T00068]